MSAGKLIIPITADKIGPKEGGEYVPLPAEMKKLVVTDQEVDGLDDLRKHGFEVDVCE